MKIRLVIIFGIIIVFIMGVFAILNMGNKRRLIVNKDNTQEGSMIWSDVLQQAVQEEASGNLIEARLLYEKLVTDYPNSPHIEEWQDKVWDLNIRLLFSPLVIPGSVLYEIKQGDSLAKIAKRFNTTVDLIKVSNGLSSDVIVTGRKLRVWTKPFNIVIDKSQNILILKSDDRVIKTYTVSTGVNNSTPVGKFRIVNKLVNPVWFKAGAVVPPESPDNILGSRWMGFDLPGYGIHGTNQNETIGQQVTQGCIRMLNSDVEELFIIIPRGTEVIIVD